VTLAGQERPASAVPAAPPAASLQIAMPVPAAPAVVTSAQEAVPYAPAPPAPELARRSPPTPATQPERRGRRSRRNVWAGPIPTAADWAPPEGPVRIALQAGHWRADEAPAELSGLRDNGTSAQGKAEWEVNLTIAERAAGLLEGMGYEVDVLPAVVPPSYRAHLFISIHADGSGDPRATGFRVASPRNDPTGRAAGAARLLERSYAEATGIERLPTVTRRMQNYYAFNFRRYVHALHPMTIGVILETGFLTSAADRRIIVDDPDRAARGIADAVAAFPLTPPPLPAPAIAAAGGVE
jgi:N-acetylmuramoyl-L-alanine amidase